MFFDLPIGDWSSDGHGKCDWFTVETNKPLQECFDAWFFAKEKFPTEVHPDNICSDYQDNTITIELREQIKELGFTGFDDMEIYNDEIWMDREKLAEYQIWFMMQGDSNLQLKILPGNPKFINWTCDEGKDQHRTVHSCGYGLFE